jgi:hypothetical protein
MSYKPALLKYCTKRNQNLLERKDAILLAKRWNIFVYYQFL